jgi:membrane-bound ClpP family serine protease
MELWVIGLAFIIIGIFMLLAEATSPGFFIAIPATVLIVLGIIGLIVPEIIFGSYWGPIIAVIIAAPATIITILLYQRLATPGPPTTTAAESLIGKSGIVTKEIIPESISGKVRIMNQIWSATSVESISKGERIMVVDSKGVHVVVKRIQKRKESLD